MKYNLKIHNSSALKKRFILTSAIFDNIKKTEYTKIMQKYIEKMKVELTELSGKISRAEKAIENPPYGSDNNGVELLKKQVTAMRAYREILQERIDYEVSK